MHIKASGRLSTILSSYNDIPGSRKARVPYKIGKLTTITSKQVFFFDAIQV